MQLEDYFDFTDPHGEIRLKGHRVWIQHILHPYLEQGKSPEQIAADLPTLSLDKIYATILYYLVNKDAVDKYLRAVEEEAERQRSAQPPPTPEFLERVTRARAEREARQWGRPDEPRVSAG